MLEASVITWSSVKESISCDDCRIEYSKEHYEVLFKKKKIIYFDFKFPSSNYVACLCHECLFKNVKNSAEGGEVEIEIYYNLEKYHCRIP